MRELTLRFGPTPRRSCRVRVGVGLLDALIEDLAAGPPGSPLLFVSDTRVGPLHAAPLVARARERGLAAELILFGEGEPSKTRETKAALEDRLLARGAGRDAAIVAVGGGVTGDLAGFLAATWHRGIPVVQVPTSLLAMADAALGGKTAVNVGPAKNVVGAFHQPLAVWADVALLATQDEASFREGFAEVVKLGVVADRRLFSRVERDRSALASRDPEALASTLEACLRLKGRIAGSDERELGRRAALNFGHTIGHALEAASGFTLRHGPAVAVGLCVEGRLAVEHAGFPQRQLERVVALVDALGLPTRLPRPADPAAVLEATRHDKKVRAGRVRYALPLEIGRMPRASEITRVVPDQAVLQVLSSSIDEATPAG